MGDVYGYGNTILGIAANNESARSDLRNNAAEKGGNVVSIDTITNTAGRIDIVGQAYKCP